MIAFTLVELLVVIGIIIIMAGLMVPAFNAIKGGGDITKAGYDIAGTVEGARAYALANNTYTWVGFYEENADALAATNTPPPYTGKGKVVMAIIASKDGTTIVDDTVGGSQTLDATKFSVVNKAVKITGVHLTDIGAPSGTGNGIALNDRSPLPYSTTQGLITSQNRISSDATEVTLRPFVAQGYTFYKTIRFSPRGEANLNSTYKPRRMAEIGMRPARGNIVDTTTPNVVAIQFTGIGGKVNLYRK